MLSGAVSIARSSHSSASLRSPRMPWARARVAGSAIEAASIGSSIAHQPRRRLNSRSAPNSSSSVASPIGTSRGQSRAKAVSRWLSRLRRYASSASSVIPSAS